MKVKGTLNTKVTRGNLRNQLLSDAIFDSHNTATEIYSADPRTVCDRNRCYGRFSEALALLEDFNLITSKQLDKITALIPNDEAISNYLKKIK